MKLRTGLWLIPALQTKGGVLLSLPPSRGGSREVLFNICWNRWKLFAAVRRSWIKWALSLNFARSSRVFSPLPWHLVPYHLSPCHNRSDEMVSIKRNWKITNGSSLNWLPLNLSCYKARLRVGVRIADESLQDWSLIFTFCYLCSKALFVICCAEIKTNVNCLHLPLMFHRWLVLVIY